MPKETLGEYAPVEKSGILNLNKPSGLSSMDVIRVLKKIGKIKKIGHAGTLDPMATGVLPILINKATKLSGSLMASSKEYDGTFVFGQEYDSQDITGNPTGEFQKIPENMNLSVIQKAALNFIGEISQIPPVFSAIKKNGKPLYKYARLMQQVEVNARKVFVNAFDIIAQTNSQTCSFYVSCGKGVYVRTLVHDLGSLLGCPAALSSLRRLRVGKLLFENSVQLKNLKTPDDISEALLNPEDYITE